MKNPATKNHMISLATFFLLITILFSGCGSGRQKNLKLPGDKTDYVSIQNDKLIKNGQEFIPNGINLGNYLLLEGFMVGMPGTYSQMIRVADEVMGEEAAGEFWKTYEENYITENDIKYIADLGLNFIRLPFNQNRFVDQNHPDEIDPVLWARLDSVVAWSKKYDIPVLLDLHAVPGGQSLSNYADAETGDVLFWKVEAFRKSATAFWLKIADHFKDEPAIFGYGLLNESNTGGHTDILTQWLQETIEAIRTVDQKHIIVVSGEDWGKSMEGLNAEMFHDPLVMPEIHFYPSFITSGKKLTEYPTIMDGVNIDKSSIEYWIDSVTTPDYGRPVLLGEFGTRWGRNRVDADINLMKDLLDVLKERNMGWSLWAYKDVGAMGVMHPKEETAWIKYKKSDHAKAVNKEYRSVTSVNWGNLEETGSMHAQLLKFRDVLPDNYLHKKGQGLNRRMEEVALKAMLDPMKSYSQEELNAVAASFSYENCEPFENAVEFLNFAVSED